MKTWNKFAIFVLLFAAASPLGTTPARSAGADWPPVDPAELAMKDNPASSGSLAMVLFREEIVNSKDSTEVYYYRIKIFTEEGKKHADVEIPFVKGLFDIKDIHARTIHPDGKTIDFSGQVIDKLVVKSGDVKVLAKTFTLPDVTPGSIVEYRYRIQRDSDLLYNILWRIQEDLYTKRAHFVFQPYQGSNAPALLWRSAHLDAGIAPQKQKDGSWSLEVHDVPGLPDEDYMLPEDELRGHLEFVYTNEDHPKDSKLYWDTVKSKFQFQEEFIGKRGSIRDAVAKLVTNDDLPEQKLRKLYGRAQQIHNVDADREKTSQEAKREKTKENNNIDDVLKHGTGDSSDIDYLFVGFAQAAGFDSGIVWIAPRNERRFDPGLQDRRMLDDFLVWVHAGDKDYFLDPGSSLCPFGQLPWYETAVTGLRPTKQGAVFMPVPASSGTDSAIARRAQLKLDESDGTMSGTLVITYTGQRALTRRKDARNQDETGKNKIITDEVKQWFPTNAKFELTSITGWDKPDTPLEVQGKLTLPGMAESVGRRVLLPLGLYEAGHPQMFQTASRKQDIYFHFPYVEQDDITIQVPQGWHAESLPEPDVVSPGGQLRYEISAKQDGDALHVQRKLIVGGIVYPVDSYGAVRKFFGAAKEGDEKQLILQTTPSSK